ncbi:MAG: DciA family protein [Alphaproteobacteria bacterium]
MPKLTKPLYAKRGFAEAGVLNDWPDIVGHPLADYTAPERLSPNGVLEVRVGGAWALEHQHLEPLVLERIAGYFGYRAVTRLSLIQGPLPPPAKPRKKHRPKVLSKREEAALKRDLAETEDANLRAALERLGREVLGEAPDDDSALER